MRWLTELMAKILITDGESRAALAITRSLGREGHEIIVGAERQPSLAGSSRFCRKQLSYASPQNHPHGFLSSMRHIVEQEMPEVVLPVTEVTTLLLAEARENAWADFAFPFPPYATVDAAAQKEKVINLAQKLGVPIPRTCVVHSQHALMGLVHSLSPEDYPVVLKPSRSRVLLQGHSWRSTSVRYAQDRSELHRISAEIFVEEFPLLIQERIHGPGVGVFLCFRDGRAVAAFSHRRIREKPPSGGVSVYRESIPVNAELKSHAEKLLKGLGWQGVAMVEFKQDLHAGDHKLMEINGRFWGSLQLAIDAGVDFPLLALNVALGEPCSPVTSYRTGVRTRWLWGEVDALLTRLFKPDRLLHLPPGHAGRIQSVWELMRSFGRGVHCEILDLDDMEPWFYETRKWFGF